MKKILVTGSIAYDVLLQYDGSFADAIKGADLEHLSVSFFSPHYARHHGGTGANIAWNLRLINQEPLLAGTVGVDGGAYTALLEERGVGVDHIDVMREHVTATAIIGTDSAERQITFFHPGADAHGSWPGKALMDLREDIAYGIVSPRNATLMMEAGRWCKKMKIPWLFDPGQQVLGFSADELELMVKSASGVVVNEYEWSLLSERLNRNVDAMLKLTPFLIITQGENGLTIHSRDGTEVLPACTPDNVVNPTGAGDGLRAGFLTGLAAGWTLRHCGQFGASIASFVVEQEGTLIDFLEVNDVRERAAMAYGEELPTIS